MASEWSRGAFMTEPSHFLSGPRGFGAKQSSANGGFGGTAIAVLLRFKRSDVLVWFRKRERRFVAASLDSMRWSPFRGRIPFPMTCARLTACGPFEA